MYIVIVGVDIRMGSGRVRVCGRWVCGSWVMYIVIFGVDIRMGSGRVRVCGSWSVSKVGWMATAI
jgi:hypothetical protein